MFAFLVEMICWGPRKSYLEHQRWVDLLPQDPILMLLRHVGRSLNRASTGKFTKAGRTMAKRMLQWWEHSKWTDHVNVFLRAVEIGNSIW